MNENIKNENLNNNWDNSGWYMNKFLIGGLAGCLACLGTNPLEVVKTRFQLHNELSGDGNQKHYRSVY